MRARIRAFLEKDYPPENLPTVEQAQELSGQMVKASTPKKIDLEEEFSRAAGRPS